ncbi:M23 family metallopeptidase [Coxiella endosymbiont of Amblyomma nuttalli]|uniref:M23 family metallopeptidase n=1 Tax=Coxiella endosymbiont of Amblyomma nuttalli TaxID=2749996 RepID=UPI001BAC094D|nr:peptidoglycan DD-metalloendopeptidase family protein [Coxiella endosymbiont of Amblyomma nuttalli]QTS83768.1 Murein DD-endopeptidase MepM [Coxiella endosymbiont of Amblyomma nuttalli]
MQGWKSTISIIAAISVVLITLTELFYKHLVCNNKKTTALNLPASTFSVRKIATTPLEWQKIIVQKKEDLSAIFDRLKINQHDLLQVIKQHKSLATLHPYQILYFQIEPPHQLIALKCLLSTAETAIIIREGNHFIKKISHNPVSIILAYKAFTIFHSLNRDAKKAGLTTRMLSELQTIFGEETDFSHNLHLGSGFNLLYQEEYIYGRKYCDGDIIAAEFIHQGKISQAVRYTHVKRTAYYTPDGLGVEACFLHSPLHYKRISSYFSHYRFDPVLHRMHPHLGIDFAANIGTPIKSIGEGSVVFVGKDGGYGKTIKVGYGRHYIALYGHMSRFAKIKLHEWVHKGQIIGYVGASGWATGPHLHFGFYMDGKPRDWLAMKLPIAHIPRSYKKPFLATAKQLLAELHLYQNTQLAANNKNPLD